MAEALLSRSRVDMIAEGIIDPAKVTLSALQNVASIAALFQGGTDF